MKHLLLTMTIRIIAGGVAAMTQAAAGRPIALVTGGTRGIGSGIATVLSEGGYDLLLTYNSDKEAADEFVSSLKSANEDLRAECVGGDISLCGTRDEIFSAVDRMRGDGGRLEVVVHNAGQYVGITSSNTQGIGARRLAFGDGSLLGEDGRADLETMRYYQVGAGVDFELLRNSLTNFRMSKPATLPHAAHVRRGVGRPPRALPRADGRSRDGRGDQLPRGHIFALRPGPELLHAWLRQEPHGVQREGVRPQGGGEGDQCQHHRARSDLH